MFGAAVGTNPPPPAVPKPRRLATIGQRVSCISLSVRWPSVSSSLMGPALHSGMMQAFIVHCKVQ